MQKYSKTFMLQFFKFLYLGNAKVFKTLIVQLFKFLQVMQELAKRCPNLTHLLMDFSQANQANYYLKLIKSKCYLNFKVCTLKKYSCGRFCL